MTDHDDLVAALAEATAANRPLPAFADALDLETAFALQHRLTALRSPEGAGGLKLGLTDARAQAAFGLDQPLLASLYAGGRLASGARIEPLEGRLIECELGLLIDPDGTIIAAFPAIELVYVAFAERGDMTAANLVASNLGADLFVVGEPREIGTLETPVAVELTSAGEVLNAARVSESLQEQGRTTRWVCDEAARRGFRLGGETTVLMGTRGTPVPCEPGRYVADYGQLGSVEIVVT